MKPPFDIAADLDTPVSAYLKLKPFRPRFLLESVEGAERLARYSFIGFGDCLEVRLDDRGLTVDGKTQPAPTNWPPSEPVSNGTMCHLHGSCARYQAAEFNSNPRQVFIGTCGPDRPLYIDTRKTVKLVELAAKAGQA